MGVASYVVNFDELAQYLQGSLDSGLDEILNNILKEIKEIPHYEPFDYREVLETQAQNTVNGLNNLQQLLQQQNCFLEGQDNDSTSVVSTLEEILETLEDISNKTGDGVSGGGSGGGFIDYTEAWRKQIHNTATGFQSVLEHLCVVITTLTNMGRLLERMREDANPAGIPKVKGNWRPIHALNPATDKKDFTIYNLDNDEFSGHTFVSQKNILLTGITYSQSAWKYQDHWSVDVGGLRLLDTVYTKEVAERKTFRKYFPIPAGTPIDVILMNNSGNSRQVWTDVEYIELLGDLPNIDPKDDLIVDDSSYDKEQCPEPDIGWSDDDTDFDFGDPGDGGDTGGTDPGDGGTDPGDGGGETPTEPSYPLQGDKVLFTAEPIGEELFGPAMDEYETGKATVEHDITKAGHQEFAIGDYPSMDVAMTDTRYIETIYVPPGHKLIIYKQLNFVEPVFTLTEGLWLDFNLRIDNEKDEMQWLNGHLGPYYNDLMPPGSFRKVIYWTPNSTSSQWWFGNRQHYEHGFGYYKRKGSFRVIGPSS